MQTPHLEEYLSRHGPECDHHPGDCPEGCTGHEAGIEYAEMHRIIESTALQLASHQRKLADLQREHDRWYRQVQELSQKVQDLVARRLELEGALRDALAAMRADYECGRLETEKELAQHGYASLRFADTRHGWLFSTRRTQRFIEAWQHVLDGRKQT